MYESSENEDEMLARRLQEEEERSLSHKMSNHSATSDLSKLSAQEREDMMLARQMQQMDSFGKGCSSGSNSNRGADPPTHSRRNSREPAGAYAGFAQSGSGNNHLTRSPDAGGAKEDRLAYARRLQEQAFQRVQAVSKPQTPQKSTEESDLELAMKMQIEEGGGAPLDQEDEDLKLARFMEESGVSIRDLDEEGLAAAKDGSASSLSTSGMPNNNNRRPGGGISSSSLGLGASAATAGSGGLLGGLYGNRRDDDSDDDSLELGFEGNANQKMPAGVPSSIPLPGGPQSMPPSVAAVATGMPSSIPPLAAMPAPVAQPASPSAAPIPAAIPPASVPQDNRKHPPPGSSTVAAIPLPGGRSASIRLGSNQKGNDFQRQLPKPSKSSGAGTGGRTGLGLSRMLPSPSKSFGAPRSGRAASRNTAFKSTTSRNAPTHTQSAHNLVALRNAARNAVRPGRSVSPNRGSKGRKDRPRVGDLDLLADPMLGDLPPGVNMGNDPGSANNTPVKKKKGKIFSRMFGGGKKHRETDNSSNVAMHGIPAAIPAAIPGPPGGGEAGPLPYSVSASRGINQNSLRSSISSQPQAPEQKQKNAAVCSVCGGRTGKMLVAMDKKFHVDCFRCMSCNEVIDPSSVFAVSVDPMGEQQPLHRKCYAEFYGVQCAVCRRAIPANDDGSVSFIKHPFFNTEQMCPCHADEAGRRRCTGCHRFEPEDEPFADLNDGDRCVCNACCRTVIMNNVDVEPLWEEVLRFFEFQLGIPIWEEMKEIPILVVGQAALNENQLKDGTSVHGDSSQIMTRGLCLSEHDGSMSFRVPSQRFNDSTASFEACNHSGFMDFDVGPLKGNCNSEVMAILCLSGLPRDLTASVLAHEATHAWIKLHPDFKVRNSLPAQVEEGCAQLVAYLFLSDGLEAPRRHSGLGPSDEKLRQYFKFSIETDDNDIYGEGYRRAALAYSTIGIGALLNHVVHHQAFPDC